MEKEMPPIEQVEQMSAEQFEELAADLSPEQLLKLQETLHRRGEEHIQHAKELERYRVMRSGLHEVK